MPLARSIDLNADVGESLYEHHVGDDETLIPLLTSANVACGFHGGDPATLIHAVELAIQHGVRIGAHPSYDDRVAASAERAFGRVERNPPPALLAAQLEVQLAALKGLVEARSARLSHVKLHGALYHRVSRDAASGVAVLEVIKKLLPAAAVIAQAGSPFATAARNAGFRVFAEAFADRLYLGDGTLAPRGRPGAVIAEPDDIAEQALAIAQRGTVRAEDGTPVPVAADTICLHGDHPGAAAAARRIRERLGAAGIRIA